jgi:hypothetical protein
MAQDECWTRVRKQPVNGSLSYWLPRPCALGVLRLELRRFAAEFERSQRSGLGQATRPQIRGLITVVTRLPTPEIVA